MAISTNGTVLARVAGALYNTQMSNATYNEVAAIVTTSASLNALVNDLYARDFGATKDLTVAQTLISNLGLSSVAGLDNWVAAQITAAGAANKGAKIVELLNSFAQMTSDATYGSAAAAFNSKVDASLTLSQTSGNTGGTFAAAATTVNNATFTLTTGLDTGSKFTGGAGDDTFTSVDTSSTSTTLTTGDSLVGGAGSDTLLLVASGGAAVSAATVSTSGIETLSVVNNNSGLLTVDATLMSGLTGVKTTTGTAATSVTNIGGIANAELVATQYGVTLASTTAAAAGTADATTITLNGAGTSADLTVTYNKVETANIVTTGVASGKTGSTNYTVTIAGDEIDTVNVSGSVTARLAVTLDGADDVAQVGKVNLSGATVGMTVAVTEGDSGYVSITGSAGNDTITDSSTLDKYHTIDGGAGTDTLAITGSIAYSTTATTQAAAGVTNFETLAVNGNTADLRAFPNNTFTSVTSSSSSASTVSKANATLATATLSNGGDLTLTRATDGTADAITLNLTKTAAATISAVSLADEETITIASGGTSGTNTISTLTVEDATSITVTGARPFVVTDLVGEVALKTIDASAHTGSSFTINATDSNVAMTVKASAGTQATDGGTVNTITTGSGADTVTGGAYKDVITTGAGADSIIGGAGNDSLTAGAGNDYADGGDGDDTINGDAGNDVLVGGAGNDALLGGSGDDSISGGDGNDTITTGAGKDSVDAGAGTDTIYATSLTEDSIIIGGLGTDTLSATSVGSSFAADDYIGAAFDEQFVVTDVETIYLAAQTSTSNDSAATGETLDMTLVTGVTTLRLDIQEGDNDDDDYLTVKNFSGSAMTITESAAAGYTLKSLTLDGKNQAALTVTLQGLDQSTASSPLFTVEDVTAVTLTGTSYVSTSAQTNTVGAVAADSVSTITLTTSGNTTATNANAFTAASVSADDATSVNITVGQNDTMTTGTLDTGSNLVESVAISLGDTATLATTLNFGTSSIDTMTVSLTDDALFAGASGAMTSVTASKISAFTGTLAAGSDALFSLVSDVTAGTITVATGATLDMDYIGKASSGGDSSVTISGRGGWASSAAVELRGDDVTLNFSALTGGNAVQVTAANITGTATISAGTVAASITGGASNDVLTGGAGADSITGGAGNDTINGGAGDDTINGGDGNDSITISLGTDTIDLGDGANTVTLVSASAATLTRTSSSTAISDSTALTVTGVDTIASFTTGDTLSFSGLSSTIVAGTQQTVQDGKISYIRGAATNANTFTTSTTGSDVLVVWDSDTTTSGTFKAVVLIGYGSLVASDTITYTGIVGVA